MNDEGTGKVRVGAQRGWEIVRWLLIPWATWVSISLIGMTERVSVIESNRFTSKDGLQLWLAIGERPLRDDVVSPSLFLQSVESLEGRLGRIEEKLP